MKDIQLHDRLIPLCRFLFNLKTKGLFDQKKFAVLLAEIIEIEVNLKLANNKKMKRFTSNTTYVLIGYKTAD